jgi:hypothetical protein
MTFKFNKVEGGYKCRGLGFVYPYALGLQAWIDSENLVVEDIDKVPFSGKPFTQRLSFSKHGTLYSGIYGAFHIKNKNKWGVKGIHFDLDVDNPNRLDFQIYTDTHPEEFMGMLQSLSKNLDIFTGAGISLSRREGLSFFQGIQDKPIFSKEVANQLGYSIYTPILHHADFPDSEFKRGVLLHGTYGMGKSSVASYTAHLANQLGITFLYCKTAHDFVTATEYFSVLKGKKIVFVEDIDKLFKDRERDSTVDDILNSLDSVDNKSNSVMYIFTTNELEVIERAMLRPGRIDSVLGLELPNKEAMFHILSRYTDGNTLAVSDFLETLKAGESYSPAFLREMCQRAKYILKQENKKMLTGQDLVLSLETLKPQIALVNADRKVIPEEQKLYQNLMTVINRGVHGD